MSEEYARFRRWLVDKLKQTRWRWLSGDDLESVSVRLGVRPEVIREAQAELSAEHVQSGRAPERVGDRRKIDPTDHKVHLKMPRRVYEDFMRYAKVRQLQQGVLLRSCIHTLLSGPDQPQYLGSGWFYRGHRLQAPRSERYYAHTWITHGARRALTIRADASGCKATALIRGSVIELLEGRVPRLIMAADPRAMWSDETRYWLLRREETTNGDLERTEGH